MGELVCVLSVMLAVLPALSGAADAKTAAAQRARSARSLQTGAGSFMVRLIPKDTNHEQHRVHIRQRRSESLQPPVMRSLEVSSNISARFGETRMTSVVANDNADDREITFQVQIPEAAFISNFSMVINDMVFVGEVMEKEDAERAYEEARERNETAGQVAADPPESPDQQRGMEFFQVSINVAAESSAQFTLTYQQVLQRTLGLYKQRLSLQPLQPVEQLSVHVSMYEPNGFRFVEVDEPNSNSVVPQDTTITFDGDYVQFVSYSPSIERQRELGGDQGINGELVVTYDTNHEQNGGLIFADNGYFVHFFSPDGLDPLPKNVVFVIDMSGSMSGLKIVQTGEAMVSILEELRPQDRFEMIFFDDDLIFWHGREMVAATANNIRAAQAHVIDTLEADGSTDINAALVAACDILYPRGQVGQNLVFFLTDGQPTSGVTDEGEIVSNVVGAAGGNVAVYSLGFGFDLNFELLKKISYETGGWVQAIYPEDDSRQQLEAVYMQVGTPVLYDVKLVYEENAVDAMTLTQTQFPAYFNGSELLVAGQLQPAAPDNWVVTVEGILGLDDSSTEQTTFTAEVDSDGLMLPEEAESFYPEGFAERLWAAARIRHLLERRVIASESQAEALYSEALQLSLRYNLVTPITSMVVVQNSPRQEMFHTADSANVLYSSPARKSMFGAGYCLFPHPVLLLMLIAGMACLLSHQT